MGMEIRAKMAASLLRRAFEGMQVYWMADTEISVQMAASLPDKNTEGEPIYRKARGAHSHEET
ncbi:hypothetical protein [Brevibacillus parabrevis]|uniref:Uncharacterized protein n=1 Tax=Brevibacillus parabrevis TaxID=54914 RepID=A0A4Y3PBX0_BREPA|nr:hypothetical protein [Brevibacillus parabrevis]GEB30974.1 hypothetical protein BPA01_05540 [Brevibacillus parabrevis]